MIKANELRIGNWIYELEHFSQSPVKVDEIRSLEYVEHVNNCRIDFYEPIPLTDEILLKLGFKKTGAHSKEYNKRLQKGYLWAWTGEDACAGHCIEVNDLSYDTHDSEIKYLHQLQNLYFSLTNQELTIEL